MNSNGRVLEDINYNKETKKFSFVLDNRTIEGVHPARYNNVVVIWNPDLGTMPDRGTAFVYLHFAETQVRVQQPTANQAVWINPGDIIGIEGETGYSYGRHAHVEVRKNVTFEQAQAIHNGINPDDINQFELVESPLETLGRARQRGILDKPYRTPIGI